MRCWHCQLTAPHVGDGVFERIPAAAQILSAATLASFSVLHFRRDGRQRLALTVVDGRLDVDACARPENTTRPDRAVRFGWSESPQRQGGGRGDSHLLIRLFCSGSLRFY
jgi:hypothetical protein